jgi:hypothetical protein
MSRLGVAVPWGSIALRFGGCGQWVCSGEQKLELGGLSLEEHALIRPYCEQGMETRCFAPMVGSAKDILARHQSQRERVATDPSGAGGDLADWLVIDTNGRSIAARLEVAPNDVGDETERSTGRLVVTVD